MTKSKIDVKDLINIGLFTAVYFIFIAPPGILGIIPIFMLLLPAMIGLVGGIPVMLLITKTQKFGALTICGVVVSLLLAIMGHPWVALILSVPVIVIADMVMAMGQYKSWKLNSIGYIIFSFWPIGNLLPFYFMRNSYLAFIQDKYGTDYEATVEGLFSIGMIPIILITTIIGAWIGAYIAKGILKKHFKRAGII
ncbi:MptD family putative ECF transporter S component [Staphylococcus saprophyticus]|uniref:MptD family putative ECF transporter S component n=1 Tax=Staphylococcus saprophyticus TaxID=29385 RepID=UPI0010108931|nr:MptD family putative ECF transporter S component [Staphylococcus saprophyticus]MBN6094097.1 MptD family putative ECF transporter S component [Staphylococcus saprophyticus]MBN6097793.1 MptD family putative ECF transporter S component [Staphylococcus saprophyticus]MBN6099941.1 MptD family putative ECF transporter S component [Staphylococcus saprophyticus]MDW3784791.1 MptD family putative ECF transporter S component [Staphylococcus saprophyticus]MDW4180713.1 MptD family putative ECF transporte